MATGNDSCNSLGVSEFCEWIQQCDHEFPEAVVEGLRENGIDGSLFLQLTTEELKELAPRIADRVALRLIQSTVSCSGIMLQVLRHESAYIELHVVNV